MDTRAGNGGNPIEVRHRFGGREMGYVTNDGGTQTSHLNYDQSIGRRDDEPLNTQTSGGFYNGYTAGSSYTRFDDAYQAINSFSQVV